MFKMTIISVAKGQHGKLCLFATEQERENLHSVDSWIRLFASTSDAEHLKLSDSGVINALCQKQIYMEARD